MKQGFSFEFDPPDGWKESQSGSRLIFHGPKDEELIVSGAVMTGSGVAADFENLRRRLADNGIRAMERAIEGENVNVIEPLHRFMNQFGLECWTLRVRSDDESTLFLQACFVSETGVLLATFEGPVESDVREEFEGFLEAVRQTSPSADV